MWIVIYRFKNKSKIEMFTLQFIFLIKFEFTYPSVNMA